MQQQFVGATGTTAPLSKTTPRASSTKDTTKRAWDTPLDESSLILQPLRHVLAEAGVLLLHCVHAPLQHRRLVGRPAIPSRWGITPRPSSSGLAALEWRGLRSSRLRHLELVQLLAKQKNLSALGGGYVGGLSRRTLETGKYKTCGRNRPRSRPTQKHRHGLGSLARRYGTVRLKSLPLGRVIG